MSELFKPSMGLETKEYLQTVMKGFVWIFMFVVSIIAMFLIFKTPYYQYYQDKSPLQLNSNGEVVNKPMKSVSENNSALKFSNKANKDMIQEFNDLSAENEYRLSDNPKKISSANNSAEDMKEDSSKHTKFLKDTSKKDSKSIIENSSTSRETKLKKELASNKYANSKSSDLTNLLKTSKKGNTNSKSVASNSITGNKSSNSASVATKNKSVWLVNIYSSTDKGALRQSLNTLKSKYPALGNSSVYFTEFFRKKGKTYRISVAKKTNTANRNYYYTTKNDANQFCSELKSGGLDCFVSSVFLPSLSKYAIK